MRHCLFCLKEVDADVSLTERQPCLQSPSRFLGLELGEAPLCEGCSLLNDDFSELYVQLEVIRMKMASCINLVREKLLRNEEVVGVETGTGTGREEKAAVNGLRKLVAQKCSKKLTKVRPRVFLKHLSRGDMEKLKLKSSTLDQGPPSSPSPTQVTSSFDPEWEPESALGEDGPCSRDMSLDAKVEKHEPLDKMKCDIGFLTTVDDLSTHLYTVHFDGMEEESPPKPISSFVAALDLDPDQGNNLEVESESKPFSRDPLTGRYECPICQQEYSREEHVHRHYKSVHLQSLSFSCQVELSPEEKLPRS